MNGLEETFSGKIDFLRLNVGELAQARIQQRYQVRGHPTIVILDDQGAVVGRFYGVQTADELRPVLEEVVASTEN